MDGASRSPGNRSVCRVLRRSPDPGRLKARGKYAARCHGLRRCLHRMAVRYVRASAQSDALEAIRAELTEEETAVFKRGRNANGVKAPKNALLADYRRATGLEALFGWLYLSRKTARLRELFSRILAAQEEEGQGLE